MSLGEMTIHGGRGVPPGIRAQVHLFFLFLAERMGPEYTILLHGKNPRVEVFLVPDELSPRVAGGRYASGEGARICGLTRQRNSKHTLEYGTPRYSIFLPPLTLRNPLTLADTFIHELQHVKDIHRYMVSRFSDPGRDDDVSDEDYVPRRPRLPSVAKLEARAEVAMLRLTAHVSDSEVAAEYARLLPGAPFGPRTKGGRWKPLHDDRWLPDDFGSLGAPPPGWKTTSINDLLPPAAIDELSRRMKVGGFDLTALKALCQKYSTEIESRGNDPRFVAYALAHALKLPLT